MNLLFKVLNASSKLRSALSLGLLRMQLQCIQSDFKSENLLFRCSIATNLVTSLNDPFQSALLLGCVVYGTVRNKLFKMRNQAVEMRNRPKTSLVLVQNVFKRSAIISQEHFRHEIMNPSNKIVSNPMTFIIIFV